MDESADLFDIGERHKWAGLIGKPVINATQVDIGLIGEDDNALSQ